MAVNVQKKLSKPAGAPSTAAASAPVASAAAASATAPSATAARPRGRRRQRRDEILAAAAKLFHEHGYHATGIDDIGAAAGITGPAVYRHFHSKEEILETLVIEYGSRILERSAEIAAEADTPASAMAGLVSFQVASVIAYRSIAAVAFFERRTLQPATRAAVDRMDRINVAEWVHVLCLLRPDLSEGEARVMVRAALFLCLSICNDNSGLDDAMLESILTDAIMRTLTATT